MRPETNPPQVRLNAWREQGADRLDPVRFRFIEALASRALRHEGVARRLVDEKLSALLDGYAVDLAKAPAVGSTPGPRGEGASADHSPMATLLAHASGSRPAESDVFPELPALAEFRQLWAGLLDERRMRQSLAQIPVDAGPLNSAVLVHRAMSLMRELSPDYLQHFLAYADNLSWLERLHDARLLASDASPLPSTGRKPGTRKPRKRKEQS